MKVAIVTREPVPLSGAAINRILTYANGLNELGFHVVVLCLRWTKSPLAEKIPSNGKVGDIPYLFIAGGIQCKGGVFKKLMYLFRSNLTMMRYLINNRPDAVLMTKGQPIAALLCYIITRTTGSFFVFENSEYPWLWQHAKTLWQKIAAYFHIHTTYKMCDGMILMTRTLVSFYKPLVRKSCRLHWMPMSVESKRFEQDAGPILPYIGYCGDLSFEKDGVDILIKAFALVADEFPDLRLKLVGKPPELHMQKVQNLIHSLGLDSRIDLEGYKTREEVPPFTKRAMILALSRPDSKQAQGGFPTKLGEYLSSGRPVIVTKVGEIADYLTDGSSAFICVPGDIEDFANKIRYALTHFDEAELVGRRGYEVMVNNFEYRGQAKELAEFLYGGRKGK